MNALPLVSILDEVDLPTAPPSEDAGLGALRTERGLLPLESVNLQATLSGLTGHLRLAQTFVNVHEEPLEATYIFPLPERAAVVRFRLQVGDRITEGELKERGQARREYRQAIEQGYQAAITEEERPGTFTMRVGNIPSGERATVHLELAQPLPFIEGEATFRFPLVVAPRYIPGTALTRPATGSGTAADTDAVPDASRISPPVLLPGFPNPVALSLRVTFPDSDLRPLELRSSLHTIVEEETASGMSLRVLAGERLNRDFILRFRLADRTIRTGLTLHPDAEGNGGTFALTVFPPDLSEQPQRPRDLVFVLDRSGSMSGWKMVTARRAVMRLVESLNDSDRFAVYAFDNSIETPPAFGSDHLVPANFTNRTVALEFLNGVNHRGGTEMIGPLDLALARLVENGTRAQRDRVLVLITDGQVGNEAQILRQLGPNLKHVRVHALGIDRAVNAGFLQQLADLGGGSSILVESEERLEAVIDGVQRNIGTAVLTAMQVQTRGLTIEEGSLVPARLPDLFVGAPVAILGRYAGTGEGAIELTGSAADGVAWSAQVPARVAPQPALPALWARQRLRDLEDRYTISPSPALEKMIVEVSLRHGVLCRFTSFVAVDRSQMVNAGGKQHQVTQAVETPEGWGENQRAELSRNRSLRALSEVTPLLSCDAEEAAPRDRVARRMRGTATPPPAPASAPGPVSPTPQPCKKPAAPREQICKGESANLKSGAPGGRLLDTLGQVAGAVLNGIRNLFGLARQATANPLDRSRFVARLDAMLATFRTATTHPVRLAVLEQTLRSLYDLVKEIVQAGDLAPEVLRLGQAVEVLSQVAAGGSPEEPALATAWTETQTALEAYRALCEPEGFWK